MGKQNACCTNGQRLLAFNKITGDLVKPEPETGKERDINKFQRLEEKCYATIYSCLEDRYQELIDDTLSGKEALELLRDNFNMDSRARLVQRFDEFFSIKFKPDEETIGMFVRKVKQTAARCNEGKHKLSEIYISFQLIRDLPEEFNGVVQKLYTVPDEEFTVEKISESLLLENSRLSLVRYDKSKDPDTVFTTKNSEVGNKATPTRTQSLDTGFSTCCDVTYLGHNKPRFE